MSQPPSEIAQLARVVRENLAGAALSPALAKLYSQHTKLRSGQPGLVGWRPDEASKRLYDATRLMEAGFVEKDSGDEGWRESIRRAAEILEWLSHPDLNPDGLPTRLLAAAAYQLAGYPARAAGLLNEAPGENESAILCALLGGDFQTLLRLVSLQWAGVAPGRPVSGTLPWDNPDALSRTLQRRIVEETSSALGIVCAQMRWGNEPRIEKALAKLLAVAKVLLHGGDPYSYLLAKLCAEVGLIYAQNSMRGFVGELSRGLKQGGRIALDRYLRLGYRAGKTLAWPSQVRGIDLLKAGRSFALFTPTASGKTTVAELAILQSLFAAGDPVVGQLSDEDFLAPMAIYLVPSRALAAEVESKLSRVFKQFEDPVINVTGLYGGTDWGPTDVWLTGAEKTVLICTYEKGEALMRFLGPRFLDRVSLAVIDEAHYIQFDGRRDSLQSGESRSLRLESLATRLLMRLSERESRVIALSAVVSGQESQAVANWTAGQPEATPARSPYRSTRQLIGRLECLPDRKFEIRYDLLDGASLAFEDGSLRDTPYIPNPFVAYPPISHKRFTGLETRLRPYLFWAAMYLAAPDDKGRTRAVLVSITQGIGGYAEDLLWLLDTGWSDAQLPRFFQEPSDPGKVLLWHTCLRSCEDYFTRESREYRLLEKGIIVHHGKMPGAMARLLVQVIEEDIVQLVLATSTLTEGVNLPFETILIPILRRWDVDLTPQEFGNLVGRAGRPGFGTEGRALVLLEPEPSADRNDRAAIHVRQSRARYFDIIEDLGVSTEPNRDGSPARSALAELLQLLQEQWQSLSGSENQGDFLRWLEHTAPLAIGETPGNDELQSAIETLDSLDAILLSAIIELEGISSRDLSPDETEKLLTRLWQRTYAHYASVEEARLGQLFVRRGRALKATIYPDGVQRRRLYRTSLSPRIGHRLIGLYPTLRSHLASGVGYVQWSAEERFSYLRTLVSELGTIPKFAPEALSGGVDWADILHWWLNPTGAKRKPTRTQISRWYDFITSNFGYRFNWGLGSVVALAIDDASGGELREPALEDWPRTGLPWIVIWIKELLTWGTLEPVAAYLLAKDIAVTRPDAEQKALFYYEGQEAVVDSLLNPITIRDWAKTFAAGQRPDGGGPEKQIQVRLLRDFENAPKQDWRVVPVESGGEIIWYDPAGFPLASCAAPAVWDQEYLSDYDFLLDPASQVVFCAPYS